MPKQKMPRTQRLIKDLTEAISRREDPTTPDLIEAVSIAAEVLEDLIVHLKMSQAKTKIYRDSRK
ncbi:MAG: hypothetical protein M3Z37_02465 [Candidatus Eremiobacteraeota bacterium]|nr:hypothetical protein [Candidatus Eremiobacteraeota bacterium]